MGGGSWTARDFASYSYTTKGAIVGDDGALDIKNRSNNQIYKQKDVHPLMKPYKVVRECRDTEEHPNTIPVILALDVTGSMGQTAVDIAADINKILISLYENITDIEIMIMGIGDFYFDKEPLQVSQFESDIRIANSLDTLYFEFGGGPNDSESYTAAWFFGATQTDLDCWKRGKKGIIITIGDEKLNNNIPVSLYHDVTGYDFAQKVPQLEAKQIFEQIKDKYNVYHINVNKRDRLSLVTIEESFTRVIGKHFYSVPASGVTQTIIDIIQKDVSDNTSFETEQVNYKINEDVGVISW